MNAFAGTGALIRLVLRRDRVRLPVWLVSIALLLAATVQSAAGLYKSPEDWHTYATVNAANVVTRVFNGPVWGASLGTVVTAESFFLLTLLVPLMLALLIVRHTRQNEETGRAELVGAARVGRLASLTAALTVAVAAALVAGALIAWVFAGAGLPAGGSLLLGAVTAGAGLVFAAAAAIAAQVAPTARMANGLAVAAIGLLFMVRALGDSFGDVSADGTRVTSAWPTWLSPLGWISLARAYSEDNWWLLGLFAVVFAALAAGAFVLVTRRDVGFGLIPDRRGAPVAGRLLSSPLGLAWRLQRGVLLAWVIGFVLMGAAMGSLADQVDDIFGENLAMADLIQQMGGADNIRDSFFAAMLALMSLAAAGYALQACLRMRAEETSGTLESLLGTATNRIRWLLSHVTIAVGGAVVLMVAMGAATGAVYALTANAGDEVLRLATASLAYVPAVLVLIGFVVAAFGVVPRWAAGLAWGGLTVCLLFGQVGELLELPQAVRNLSPFTHVPMAPAATITVTPIAILIGVAVVLFAAGAAAFRRRDIVMS